MLATWGDPFSGKNLDHRKVWIEEQLQQFAAIFGIDSKEKGKGLFRRILDRLDLCFAARATSRTCR